MLITMDLTWTLGLPHECAFCEACILGSGYRHGEEEVRKEILVDFQSE